MNFYSLKIVKLVKDTDDVLVIYFDIPNEVQDAFDYKSGQYITLKENINGEEVRRAYSICTPAYNADLATAIKLVKNGKFSNYVHMNWREGMTVEVAPPQGMFFVKTDPALKRDHYFFASGSGVTPIMSMVCQILEEEPMSSVYLLYGNRTESSIIFKKEIDVLIEKYRDQFHCNYILSQPKVEKEGGVLGLFKKGKTSWNGKIGRINYKEVSEFLDSYKAKTKDASYYICGPGDMIDQVYASLIGKDIDSKVIKREFFTASKEVTKTHSEITVSGKHKLIVSLDGETIELEVSGEKPILDELIAIKKNPPYSCTSGACSSCMAKVTKGEAKMEICYALDDDEIAAGYILTCQAKPTSAVVELTYSV